MALAAGCAARPVLRAGAQPMRGAVPPDTTVVVLAPLVRIDQLKPEAPVFDPPVSLDALSASLAGAARAAATAAAARVVDCSAAPGATWAPICTALAADAGALARGVVPPTGRAGLATLGADAASTAVLATLLVVKLGPGGSYNSFTGQITSPTSSSVLSAALLSAPANATLWNNDVLLRSVPRPTDAGYRDALGALFDGAPDPGS